MRHTLPASNETMNSRVQLYRHPSDSTTQASIRCVCILAMVRVLDSIHTTEINRVFHVPGYFHIWDTFLFTWNKPLNLLSGMVLSILWLRIMLLRCLFHVSKEDAEVPLPDCWALLIYRFNSFT
jgi:hypothetical protein